MEIVKIIVSKFREKTTWAGLLSLAVAAGLQMSPEVSQAVSNAGMALSGLILVLINEKK